MELYAGTRPGRTCGDSPRLSHSHPTAVRSDIRFGPRGRLERARQRPLPARPRHVRGPRQLGLRGLGVRAATLDEVRELLADEPTVIHVSVVHGGHTLC